jgi:hypothetical protein
MTLALLLDWFAYGFSAPLGLWVSALLVASAWGFAKRLLKGG